MRNKKQSQNKRQQRNSHSNTHTFTMLQTDMLANNPTTTRQNHWRPQEDLQQNVRGTFILTRLPPTTRILTHYLSESEHTGTANSNKRASTTTTYKHPRCSKFVLMHWLCCPRVGKRWDHQTPKPPASSANRRKATHRRVNVLENRTIDQRHTCIRTKKPATFTCYALQEDS